MVITLAPGIWGQLCHRWQAIRSQLLRKNFPNTPKKGLWVPNDDLTLKMLRTKGVSEFHLNQGPFLFKPPCIVLAFLLSLLCSPCVLFQLPGITYPIIYLHPQPSLGVALEGNEILSCLLLTSCGASNPSMQGGTSTANQNSSSVRVSSDLRGSFGLVGDLRQKLPRINRVF